MGEHNFALHIESVESIRENEPLIKEVSWRDLNYSVEISRKEKRQILFNLNGSFKFGQMTAILGPSGSGKTTLLECLINKREKGLSGEIGIKGLKNPKASIIPQENNFLPEFTVYQVLLFASKIKNINNHKEVIENVAKTLGLVDCLQNNVKKCSGGQLKRLAIAQELVSQTNILILDEPTSGLDSSTCFQVISVLQNLAKSSNAEKPIAILSTIHQPGSRVFNLFDKIYALSFNGRCIYEGTPSNVTIMTSKVGLNCPINFSLAEHLLEICYSYHGVSKIEEMMIDHNSKYVNSLNPPISKISNAKLETNLFRIIFQIYYLWCRAFKSLTFNWLVISLQIGTYTLTPVLMSILYNYKIGSKSGCPHRLADGNITQEISIEEIRSINDNYAFLYFGIILFMMGPMMITVLTFPLEMNVISNEWRNGWYKSWSYFIGRSLADIPYQIVFPFIFCAIGYYLTGQVNDFWRYLVYSSLMVAVSFCAQSQGLIFGAIFMNNLAAATFIACVSTIPIMLFGGYLIRIAAMPQWISWLSYISYFKHAFQSILITIYGFDRCFCGTNNDINDIPIVLPKVNESGNSLIHRGECISYTMTDFNMADNDLMDSVYEILLYLLIIRIITFFIVLFKISRSV